MTPLQIFRVGQHTDMTGRTIAFSASDLAATAAAYDPARYEAPLVVGHPTTDDPAYGWVAALVLSGSCLEASPRQVDPAFAALVNEERFNRISASFFLPDVPSNPVPGVFYLRHVGFLGAAAPAVRGLKKPSFSLSAPAGHVVTFTAGADRDSHRAAFFASPDLQAEFGDVETYMGWLKAQSAGCRIIGNKTITGFARDSR